MARSLSSGGLTLVSGGAQWEAVMDGLPPSTLLVALFGLSGDPICQATGHAVRVRLRGCVCGGVHMQALLGLTPAGVHWQHKSDLAPAVLVGEPFFSQTCLHKRLPRHTE
jgi:hypothetical protein